jgi:hypothetical protein
MAQTSVGRQDKGQCLRMPKERYRTHGARCRAIGSGEIPFYKKKRTLKRHEAPLVLLLKEAPADFVFRVFLDGSYDFASHELPVTAPGFRA